MVDYLPLVNFSTDFNLLEKKGLWKLKRKETNKKYHLFQHFFFLRNTLSNHISSPTFYYGYFLCKKKKKPVSSFKLLYIFCDIDISLFKCIITGH